jgi:SAM-dependent methyltransferase
VLRILESYYRRQMFFPGVGGIFINPFYFARKGLAKHIGDLAVCIVGKTLDVGCGKKPYEKLFNSDEYIGLEYDNAVNRESKNADFFYDGRVFPFPDESFDSVVCNQVLEHVFTPDQFVLEISRVLKDDGALLLTVPFVWDEHEQPFDYARYSSFGLKALLTQNSFNVIEQRKTVTDVRVIFQLLNAYIYKTTMTRNGWLNHLLVRILTAPFNIFGELLSWITPRNPDLYLDNIVLARKRKRSAKITQTAN